MASFWLQFPDDTLSPINLAEKKWALAQEHLHKVITDCSNAIVAATLIDPTGTDGEATRKKHQDIAALDKRMKDEREHVQVLWRKWVALKPYVSHDMKVHLGCDPKDMIPQEEQEKVEKEIKRKRIKKLKEELLTLEEEEQDKQ